MFRVGVTRDFLKPDGNMGFGDIGLKHLESVSGVEWEFIPEDTPELSARQIQPYEAILVLGPRITAESLENADRLRVLARFGVGYDSVDVEACTRSGVALTITPDGVRRPVAGAVITLMLALSHKLLIKDRLTRDGRWSEKLGFMGMGLTGRTLGVVGMGNIGREVFRLAAPFEMRHIASDPYVKQTDLGENSIQLMDLDRLLAESDFVAICSALTPETRSLINTKRIALMKPTAYLINVARGPIVDRQALIDALRKGQIQGAGLDVFEKEPISPDDPLLTMENVILAPHAMCWTDECFRRMGESACQSIVDIASGRIPKHVVNREVIETDAFRQKLAKGV